MVRKLLVVLAFTLFASDESKASSAFMGIMISLFHLGSTRPYLRSFHNILASVVVGGTAVTLSGALFTDATARQGFAVSGITITVAGMFVGMGFDLYVALVEEDESSVKGTGAADVTDMGLEVGQGMVGMGSTELAVLGDGGESRASVTSVDGSVWSSGGVDQDGGGNDRDFSSIVI